MRFTRLSFPAFGPFTDLSLELGDERVLHLIHGPNEAGKSTALHGVTCLLFGFPARVTGAFLHKKESLRVGAAVADEEGSRLDFLRRRGRKNTIRAVADDKAVVSDTDLARLLGGIDRDLFGHLFGIDHGGLIQGGREISQGSGNVGQALFAAGAGITDLRRLQERLRSEREALFKPSGSKQRLNQDLRLLREARARLKEAQLPSRDFEEHQRRLAETMRRKDAVEATLGERRRERSRLERIKRTRAHVARHHDLGAQREQLDGVLLLPEAFSEQRREAQSSLENARKLQRQSQETIAAIDRTLAELPVDDALLEAQATIADLHKRSGSHKKAMGDRTPLETECRQLRTDATRLLDEMGYEEPDLDAAKRLRVTAARRVRIQDLGVEGKSLEDQVARAEALVDKLDRAHGAKQRELDTTDSATPDPTELQVVIREVRRAGDLEATWREAGESASNAEQRIYGELRSLPRWEGPSEALVALKLPGDETIAQFDEWLAGDQSACRDVKRQIEELERERSDIVKRLTELEFEQDVVTEADLAAARERREHGWSLVRASWLAGGADPDGLREFVESQAPARDLAEAYEASARNADALADRLRREAHRAAQKAQLLADQIRCDEWAAGLTERDAEADGRLQARIAQWDEAWKPTGIAPGTPREMREWKQRQQDIVRQVRMIEEHRSRERELGERIADHKSRLRAALEQVDAESPSSEETLDALLDRGESTLERIHEEQRRRTKLRDKSRSLAEECDAARNESRRLADQRSKWHEDWKESVRPLGLPDDATAAQANAQLRLLDDLLSKLDQAHKIAHRIEGIDRDADEFRRSVAELVERVDPASAESAPEQAVERLHARSTQALKDHQRRVTLGEQRESESSKLASAIRQADEAEEKLRELCRQAGRESVDELSEAEESSNRRREVEQALRDLEERLLELGEGVPMETLFSDIDQVDPDDIDPKLEQLDAEIDRLDREIKEEVLPELGAQRSEAAKVDDRSDGAEVALEIEDLVARLSDGAEQYARLRLASFVLSRGIERYREKNQGPVLERAGKLFAQLTAGSFETIRISWQGDDDGKLVGIRPGSDAEIGVEQMSEGTCDQLYLALRLASLEMHLESGRRLPFLVDDILVNFDDRRATAALLVLAELTRQTQVLFFTHHEHLLDLAAAHLPKDAFHIHRLPDWRR